jgi:hypothetical protein
VEVTPYAVDGNKTACKVKVGCKHAEHKDAVKKSLSSPDLHEHMADAGNSCQTPATAGQSPATAGQSPATAETTAIVQITSADVTVQFHEDTGTSAKEEVVVSVQEEVVVSAQEEVVVSVQEEVVVSVDSVDQEPVAEPALEVPMPEAEAAPPPIAEPQIPPGPLFPPMDEPKRKEPKPLPDPNSNAPHVLPKCRWRFSLGTPSFLSGSSKASEKASEVKKEEELLHSVEEEEVAAQVIDQELDAEANLGLWITDRKLRLNDEISLESEKICYIEEHTQVNVLEARRGEKDGLGGEMRLRGRIEEPPGWISLKNLSSNAFFAHRPPPDTEQAPEAPPPPTVEVEEVVVVDRVTSTEVTFGNLNEAAVLPKSPRREERPPGSVTPPEPLRDSRGDEIVVPPPAARATAAAGSYSLADELLSLLDTDTDGLVTREDLRRAFLKEREVREARTSPEQADELFDFLDRNRTGRVSRAELRRAFTEDQGLQLLGEAVAQGLAEGIRLGEIASGETPREGPLIASARRLGETPRESAAPRETPRTNTFNPEKVPVEELEQQPKDFLDSKAGKRTDGKDPDGRSCTIKSRDNSCTVDDKSCAIS